MSSATLKSILVVFLAVCTIAAANGNNTQVVAHETEIIWKTRTKKLPIPDFSLNMWSLLLGFSTSFLIGANDAANSWATTIGSGALTWGTGRFIAASFEIIGGMMSNSVSDKIKKVANPSSKASFADGFWNPDWDEADYHGMDHWPTGMVASQVGATAWQGVVTMLGIPSSGTHAVVGSVVGMSATISPEAPAWNKFTKIMLGWFISPMASAFLASILLWWSVSFLPARAKDLRGSKFKACKTLLTFPIFALGFIYMMIGVKNALPLLRGGADDKSGWSDVSTQVGGGVAAMGVAYALALFQSSLSGDNQKWLQMDCCCSDGTKPHVRAVIFGFVSMWLMMAASTTLLLKKNPNFAKIANFDQDWNKNTLSNLNQTSYFICLACCLVPASIAALVVHRGMSKPIKQSDLADLENDNVSNTRKGKMSPNLAVALNCNATWVGAVRVTGEDGVWVPVEAVDADKTGGIFRCCSLLFELLGKVVCKWAVPDKEARSPRVVEYRKEDDNSTSDLTTKIIFDGHVFGLFSKVAQVNKNAEFENVEIEMGIPQFDQLTASNVTGKTTNSEFIVVKQKIEAHKVFSQELGENLAKSMGAFIDKLFCRKPSTTGQSKIWKPKVGSKISIERGFVAVCVGEGNEGEFWFEFATTSGRVLSGADEQAAAEVLMSIMEEAGGTFVSAEFWCKENKKVELTVADPDYAGAADLDTQQLEQNRLHSKRLHNSFRWLLAVCACMQSFVHGANDLPNAAAAVTAFKDYRDAAINGDAMVYPAEASATGLGTIELFTICAMMGLGVIMGGSGVIASMRDVMGPELQGAHLMAYCIEVAAQLSAATFTCLDMPISTTHCEVGALCFVSFLLNGKLNQEKVCGIVFALFTAATMSGVFSYAAMTVLKPVVAGWNS